MKLEQNLPSLLVTEAENEKLITSEARGVLSTFTNLPVELFSKKSCAYGEEQWQFVATLHYYSPKAYKFFRKRLTLPGPSTLRRWLSRLASRPGFSVQVFTFLQEKKLRKLPG